MKKADKKLVDLLTQQVDSLYNLNQSRLVKIQEVRTKINQLRIKSQVSDEELKEVRTLVSLLNS